MKYLGFLGLVLDTGLSVTPLMGYLGCLASHWSVPVFLSPVFLNILFDIYYFTIYYLDCYLLLAEALLVLVASVTV